MNNNKFIKNLILHIKYPYTALVIAIMWISISFIATKQVGNLDILILAASISTILIAIVGFKSPK